MAGTGTAGFSGDGGLATSAQLYTPYNIAVDAANNLYIADYGNQRIRKVDAATGNITTIAGTGTAGFTRRRRPGHQRPAQLAPPAWRWTSGGNVSHRRQLQPPDPEDRRRHRHHLHRAGGGNKLGDEGPGTEAHAQLPARGNGG